MVEVNGEPMTDYYKPLITTPVLGRYEFKANSFGQDLNI